jgi:glutamyl-tRNA reductase
MGPGLESVLDGALSAAKRVRSETALGEGPVSIAAAACQLARDLHGELAQRRAVLVGAGDMGELIAEGLLAAGLGHLDVTASRASRAETLARTLNAHVIGFDKLGDTLPMADIVLAAVGGRTVTFSTESVGRALKARRRRPVFLIDCAIPGDIDPAVNRLDGAFLYDLADLERVAMKGRTSREQSAVTARAIITEEVEAFGKERDARQAVPTIVDLRSYFEEQRLSVLDENLPTSEATRLLINRLLHNPSEVLKEAAASGEDWQSMERLLKKLFRLE